MLPSWFNFWSSKPSQSVDLPNPNSDHNVKPNLSVSSPIATTTRNDPSLSFSSTLQTSSRTDSPPYQNRKGALLFTAGLTFSFLSLLATRRSFARRRPTISPPSFYTHAPAHVAAQASRVSGPLEAVEALNLATINVLSLAMMGTGGALWYLGIENLEDARRVARGGIGVDGSGRSEKEAEEEFEEWIATVLSRKEAKEKAQEGKRK